MTKRFLRAGAALTAALSLVLVAGTTANAAPSSKVDTVDASTQPLYFSGQVDDAVAIAHGFRVQKNADGTETAVAVTAKARAINAQKNRALKIQPNSTASGPCGASYYTLTRINSTTISQFTGYKVILPTYWQQWTVHMWTPKDSRTNDVSGANASTTWSTIVRSSGLKSTVSADGGVLPGSYAILITGDLCYAYSPSDHI